jgi:RHS repeat-associated protein
VQWTANYQPFGYTSTGIGNIVQNLRLPGQEFDDETGLYHNGFRDYAPTLGRYLEDDLIGLAGGSNAYSYASGNPATYIDETGLDVTISDTGSTIHVPGGGPTFPIPSSLGLPAISPSDPYHHFYDEPVPFGSGCDPAKIMQAIINNPTPGSPQPATAQGTLNDATPNETKLAAYILAGALTLGQDSPGNISPVMSYVGTDSNGNPFVVNLTLPSHPLYPGYVVRWIEPTQGVGGGIVHNAGEGTGLLQAHGSPFADSINSVWLGLTKSAIKGTAGCGCSIQ